jgi:hypothetical protein
LFDGAEFIIFTALKKHKRRIFEKSAGIRISCALASRTVCEWSRCESQTFCVEKPCEKTKKSMGTAEKHTLVKITSF